MASAQGINTNFCKVIALMISNGLVGLCGGVYAQYQGAADVNAGRGAIVIGLAAVIISEVIFGKLCAGKKIAFAYTLAAVFVGAILYYIAYALVMWLGIDSDYMKLFFSSSGDLLPGGSISEREIYGEKEDGKIMGYMLEIKDLHKTFNIGTINEKVALNGVNLNLDPGDFVTIIGGNGAGKSTTLNAIAGVWPIDQGKIIVDGIDVTRLSEHKRAVYLGRVFQDPMIGTASTMSIEENMAIAARRGERRGFRWGISRKEERIL